MAVSAELCKPYFSGVLFHSENITIDALRALRDTIAQTVVPDQAIADGDGGFPVNREVQAIEPDSGDFEDMAWAALHFTERRRPPWYTDDEILDLYHQLILVVGIGRTISITFSENAVRNQIVREIRRATAGPLSLLVPFSGGDINKTLVAEKVRTLWLSGTHRQSVVKADSKTLSGIELESAIDPLGDQTYFYSSIRSTVPAAGLGKNGAAAVIGTSPIHARFWVGPTENWADYLGRKRALHAHLEVASTAAERPPILPMLAQPGASLAHVEAPYGMSLIVPEAQFPDAVLDGDRDWLQQFADGVVFDLKPQAGEADFKADVHWAGTNLGTLAFEFVETDAGNTRLDIGVEKWQDDSEIGKQLKKLCQDRSLVTIYFDTGHTYARGNLYSTTFRDPRFEGWRFVSMAGIDVTKEKPHEGDNRQKFDPARIGSDDDNSLFTLVARHWPNIEERGAQEGWLICDDGSMESADFIHIDDKPQRRKVALIHVKGSGSKKAKRQISVSDYEVVVGQAVKNLRHLDRGNLHEKLSTNKNGSLKNAVWHDGDRQENRDGVLDVIKNFGSNYSVEVYVLQPRVRKVAWEKNRKRIDDGKPDSSDTRRLKQLDALLQGASADCFGLGAKFTAIGEFD